METPLILHPLQWLDNLFVGNLFLQSLQEPESKNEDGPSLVKHKHYCLYWPLKGRNYGSFL